MIFVHAFAVALIIRTLLYVCSLLGLKLFDYAGMAQHIMCGVGAAVIAVIYGYGAHVAFAIAFLADFALVMRELLDTLVDVCRMHVAQRSARRR